MTNRGAIVNRVSEVTDEMVEIASHTYVGNGGGSLVNGFVRVNMRDALTAILPMLTAQAFVAVRDGTKQATQAMLQAGVNRMNNRQWASDIAEVNDIYEAMQAAMLSAAPQHEVTK